MPTIPPTTRSGRSRLTSQRITNTLAGVLVGGRSVRFGSDKATAWFNGRTLLDHQLAILRSAGCTTLAYVGGARREGVAGDAVHVPDAMPQFVSDAATHDAHSNHSPLRGVISALRYANEQGLDRVVLIACDLPLVQPATIRALVNALDHDDVGVAQGSRTHWSCLAARTSITDDLHAAYDSGERALHRAFAPLRSAKIAVSDEELTNTNEPETLARLITESDPALG